MSNEVWAQQGPQVLMDLFARQPIALTRGHGAYVEDDNGRRYLDLVAGIAVNALGHAHPTVTKAIAQQAEQIMHCSNLYWIPAQIELAKILIDHSVFGKAFFCNSGAEANEGAIKLARRYAEQQDGSMQRFEVICMQNSFHGRTLATLTATGQDKFHQHFHPLPAGFRHVAYNDIEALRAAITPQTCAVLLEPVQGEGGVLPADKQWLQAVRQLCDQHNLLLILDEVQTGIGRTGKLFAYEHYGITPDIITLAKGLAGGVPIGGILATDPVAAAFQRGDHGSTFGGNPLVCAVACAVLRELLEGGVLQQSQQVGDYFRQQLEKLKQKHRCVVEVRGLGLLLGLRLNIAGAPIVASCLEQGLIINCTQGNVLRFTPALILTNAQVDEAITMLDYALTLQDEAC